MRVKDIKKMFGKYNDSAEVIFDNKDFMGLSVASSDLCSHCAKTLIIKIHKRSEMNKYKKGNK